jgi:branched-chain amino acid transport system permease protein
MLLFLEQCLNGLQFGLLLFLLAAGLTLVFGIMDLVNLAHGSLYMVGAYFAATFVPWTGSFIAGALLALGATLLWTDPVLQRIGADRVGAGRTQSPAAAVA